LVLITPKTKLLKPLDTHHLNAALGWLESGSPLEANVELESGEEIQSFTGYGGALYSVAVTPDGGHVVSGSQDIETRIIE
jgi:WD40 repeat protein